MKNGSIKIYISKIFVTLIVSSAVNSPLSKMNEITSFAKKNKGIEMIAKIKKHISVCLIRDLKLLNLLFTFENMGNNVLDITNVPKDTKKENVLYA